MGSFRRHWSRRHHLSSSASSWAAFFCVAFIATLLDSIEPVSGKEEIFKEKVAVRQVIGVTGGRAKIPCDLTPPFPSDEPILILFYKEGYGKPVYSFDMRENLRVITISTCGVRMGVTGGTTQLSDGTTILGPCSLTGRPGCSQRQWRQSSIPAWASTPSGPRTEASTDAGSTSGRLPQRTPKLTSNLSYLQIRPKSDR